MNSFQCGLLCVDLVSHAAANNNRLLGSRTLGIEVTVGHLADRCGLGNIDPQHRYQYRSSAVEAALTYPVPPYESMLVTIRRDLDALAAMAILEIRSAGREGSINIPLVKWIGAVDRMGFAGAHQNHRNLIPKDMSIFFAMSSIVLNCSNFWPTMEKQIDDHVRILSGDMDEEEIRTIAAERPATVRYQEFKAVVDGGVAFVIAPGKLKIARNWANRKYNIAVILDPRHAGYGYHTASRWSVIRKNGFFDRHGFETAINEAEASARGVSVETLHMTGDTWGGPDSIVSSPQGQGHATRILQEEILRIVKVYASRRPTPP